MVCIVQTRFINTDEAADVPSTTPTTEAAALRDPFPTKAELDARVQAYAPYRIRAGQEALRVKARDARTARLREIQDAAPASRAAVRAAHQAEDDAKLARDLGAPFVAYVQAIRAGKCGADALQAMAAAKVSTQPQIHEAA